MKILNENGEQLITMTNLSFEKLKKDNIISIHASDLNGSIYFTDLLSRILEKIIIEGDHSEVIQIIVKHDDDVFEYNNLNEIQLNVTNDDYFKSIHSELETRQDNLMEEQLTVNHLTRNDNDELATLNLIPYTSVTETKEVDMDIEVEVDVEVETDGFADFKTQYTIDVKTLVLDCEGAFYYILMDMPEILNNINLILMVNDYCDISHKNYIDEVLMKNNFVLIETKPGGFGPCLDNFFEAWQKYNTKPIPLITKMTRLGVEVDDDEVDDDEVDDDEVV